MDITSEQLRKLQLKELEALKELRWICDENGISYFLFAGTLIGAIRHKGFIPWDDDLDVGMTVPNYHAFQELCKTKLRDGFYLQSPESDPEAGLSYCKLRMDGTTLIVDYLSDKDIHHGINIDIYPIYRVPDGSMKRKLQNVAGALYLLMQAGQTPQNHGALLKIGSSVILFLVRGKNRIRLKNACLKQMEKYESTQTKNRRMMHGNAGLFKYMYQSEIYDNTMLAEFEGELFSIPERYDDCLRVYYGDYMQLPPVEQRGAKMKDVVKIDTDKSYKDYKGVYYCKDENGSE